MGGKASRKPVCLPSLPVRNISHFMVGKDRIYTYVALSIKLLLLKPCPRFTMVPALLFTQALAHESNDWILRGNRLQHIPLCFFEFIGFI